MKLFLVLIISLYGMCALGQVNSKINKLPNSGEPGNLNDTTLKIIYEKKEYHKNMPAYYVNGEFINDPHLYFNPTQIEKIDVTKGESEISGVKYYGKVYLTLKKTYSVHSISLSNLLLKYTIINNSNNIFTINGNFITIDHENYFVNEDDIMRIIVDKIDDKKRNLNLNLIKILTKTKENIENLNKIMIR